MTGLVLLVTIITLVSEVALQVQRDKRHGDEVDFPTCIENFDIHTDTIIRAQDSRAIGGRYINETEVSTREECLKLCCQTSLCDVFIFEEKSPGSCYLFDCGSSDDFKCKFNPHRRYTSGVMAVNRHVAELESQAHHNRHEEELAGLRKSLQQSPAAVVQLTTATALQSSSSTLRPPPSTGVLNSSSSTHPSAGRRCSRYQFECKTSGECIAIYNACDGIPQCADGSDEGVELACPATSTPPPPRPAPAAPSPVPAAPVPHGQPEGPQTYSPQFRQPPAQPVWPPAWQQQQQQAQYQEPQKPAPAFQQPQSAINPPQPPVQPVLQPAQPQPVPVQQPSSAEVHKFYSREGEYSGSRENAAVPPQSSWQPQQFHAPPPGPNLPFRHPGLAEYEDPQNSHIFNHKGNGLINDPDSGYGTYGEGKLSGGYYTGGAGSPAFRGPPPLQQQAPQQAWPNRARLPQQDRDSLLSHSVEEDLRLHGHYGAGAREGALSGGATQPQQQQLPLPPDYYNYEEGGQQRAGFHRHPQHPQDTKVPPEPEIKAHRPPALMEGQAEAAATLETPRAAPGEQAKPAPASVPEQPPHKPEPQGTTEHPLEVAHASGHYSGEGSKKKALPPHPPPPLGPEALQVPDGAAARPGGAYFSLSIGLLVTALLVALISCRFRVVRRRLHRGGGKSPYAHDADFLVNGMYL